MNGQSPSGRFGRARKLSEMLLSGDARWRDLVRYSHRLQAVKSHLWPHLPSDLRPHCDLANVRDSTLVFVCASQVWAAKLRHTSQQILHVAAKVCKINAERIQVRIDPRPFKQPDPPRTRGVSGKTAQHLEQAAEAVEDEELRERLRRIARRR